MPSCARAERSAGPERSSIGLAGTCMCRVRTPYHVQRPSVVSLAWRGRREQGTLPLWPSAPTTCIACAC